MTCPARYACLALAALLAAMLAPSGARAARVGDLCEVQGARENILSGIGIVVGLAGTGDSAKASIEALDRINRRLGVEGVDPKLIKTKNAAIVNVTATIPAYAKEGTRIDCMVHSLYDAKSLEGGTLLETYLRGPGASETVYAVAQGPVSIGGFNADAGGGTSVRKNHMTAGRVPMGAYVETEVPSTITDGERIVLLLKRPNFGTATAIQEAVNAKWGPEVATTTGGGSIQVRIPPPQQRDVFGFIAQLQDMNVTAQAPARIVFNERTGTIVVGSGVMITPCQVAHGSLTIKIATTPQVTPALPFTEAQPVVTESKDLEVEEPEAFLMPVEGTSAGEVAEALNRLRVTPRDMISIFQALREAGALDADLEIM
jgi:flagellar P-ring protein precursor FlgI